MRKGFLRCMMLVAALCIMANSYAALTLPVNMAPTENEFNSMTIINNNNDWGMWKFEEGRMFYGYDMMNDADDWAILPAINFADANSSYTFAIEASSNGPYFQEGFEVYIGKNNNIAAMTQMVMKADVATENNESYTAFSEVFSVPEAGDWYVAIKAASKKDQLRMYIRNISITQNGASDTATPAAVTDLTAVAAEMGGLTATVSFTMPTVDIFGNTLPEDTQLKAMVYSYPDGEENELTGVPGQEMSVEVNTDQNMNTILVVVYIGENKSPSQQVEVYTGVDVPGVVHNVVTTLSEDNMTITLTWEPPTEGLNGGYFDPNDENIRYWLCHYHETLGWYTNDRIGQIDGTTVNYDIWDVDPQYIYLTGIIAENAAGICTTVVPGEALLAGPPVQLPIDEEISSYQVNTFPILEWLPTEEYVPGNLMVEETTGQSYNGATGYAISCRPGQPGKVRITLPKFESTGLSPVMDLRIYFGDKTPEIKILADTHGMTEPQLIKEVDATNLSGWSTVTAVLPNKYNERFWSTIFIDLTFEAADEFLLFDKILVDGVQFADELTASFVDGVVNLEWKEQYSGQIEDYAIYRNNELINSQLDYEQSAPAQRLGGLVMTKTWTDSNVDPTETYEYYVAPIVGGEEKPESNTVIIDLSSVEGIENVIEVTAANGQIILKGLEGKNAAIYTLDGKQVYYETLSEDHISVAVEAGVYVVTVGDRSVKLIVK